MSKITIESEDSSMDRIALHTSPNGNLVIRIEQLVNGSGAGDGLYDEKIKVCGTIILNMDDVRIIEDYIEQYMYKQAEANRDSREYVDRTRL